MSGAAAAGLVAAAPPPGASTLSADRIKADVATRRVDAESNPEAGWPFRRDHYPFARHGVPSRSFRAGGDLVEGGTARGDALVGAYNAARYHQPSDQFIADSTFAGTAQEASVAYLIGRKPADGTDWPIWNVRNEYAPLRASGPK